MKGLTAYSRRIPTDEVRAITEEKFIELRGLCIAEAADTFGISVGAIENHNFILSFLPSFSLGALVGFDIVIHVSEKYILKQD